MVCLLCIGCILHYIYNEACSVSKFLYADTLENNKCFFACCERECYNFANVTNKLRLRDKLCSPFLFWVSLNTAVIWQTFSSAL